MSMIALFENLKSKIEDQDLSQYSDDEIKKLYGECFRGIDYYNSMQMTVKLEANSVYGACGNEHFRFYNPEVAGDITTEGKLLMFEVDRIINYYYANWSQDQEIKKLLVDKFGASNFKSFDPEGNLLIRNSTLDLCVYGDTDSRYVDYGTVFNLCGFTPIDNKMAVEFVQYMDEVRIAKIIRTGTQRYIEERNGDPNHLIMELEVVGGKGFFLAKKKYVMSMLMKDDKYIAKEMKMKATGVELIQGSSSKFVKDAQRFILNKLLSPNSDLMQVFRLGSALVKKAQEQKIEDLAKVNNLNKYHEYVEDDRDSIKFHKKAPPVTVRAAAVYNYLLQKNQLTDKFPRIYPGNRIHWYYSTDPTFEVFAWPDGEDLPPFALPIDHAKQIEKMIIGPLRRFINGEGVDSGGFGSGIVQPSVKMLFGKK